MWILIFAMFVGNSGGPATATFGTKSACEAAIVELTKAQGYQFRNERSAYSAPGQSFAICVPQS